MRILLTYVLAALAATSFEAVAQELALIVFAPNESLPGLFAEGDPILVSRALSEIAAGAAIRFVMIFLLVGLAWRLVGSVAANLGGRSLLTRYVFRGSIASFITVALALAILVGFGGVRSIYGLGLDSPAQAIVAILIPVLSGVVWGMVFWMRAPKLPLIAQVAA